MRAFRYIDGVAILALDRQACIGCGTCVTVCPHRVLAMEGKRARIADPGGCMECGGCARNCPAAAIQVNPDPGCGCAAYIINSWLARWRGRDKAAGSCC